MPFTLSTATTPTALSAIFSLAWTSYTTPYNPVWTFLYPTLTTRAAAIADSQDRLLRSYRDDPTAVWLQVTDDASVAVVGAALWHVHREDPFKDVKEEEASCTWWPEGPRRCMADKYMGLIMGPRVERMRRPLLLLELCFVDPAFRRRGVGDMLMRWGTMKADELGVEAFVEATRDGYPLYLKHGFALMNEFDLEVEAEERTEECEVMARDLKFHGYFQWRPPGGEYVEGETVVPWRREG